MTTAIMVTAVTAHHGFGIEHLFLIGGQGCIEGFGSLAAPVHLGNALTAQGTHLIDAIGRVELFECGAIGSHMGCERRFHGADKTVPAAFLCTAQLQLLLEFGLPPRHPFFHPGWVGPAMMFARRCGGRGGRCQWRYRGLRGGGQTGRGEQSGCHEVSVSGFHLCVLCVDPGLATSPACRSRCTLSPCCIGAAAAKLRVCKALHQAVTPSMSWVSLLLQRYRLSGDSRACVPAVALTFIFERESKMNRRFLTRPVTALLGVFAMCGALAQNAPSATITDVQPAPAENRNSVGAVELEKSPVRAKRDSAAAASQRMGAAPATEPVSPRTARAEARAERAKKRAAEAAELRRRGAGSLTQN